MMTNEMIKITPDEYFEKTFLTPDELALDYYMDEIDAIYYFPCNEYLIGFSIGDARYIVIEEPISVDPADFERLLKQCAMDDLKTF